MAIIKGSIELPKHYDFRAAEPKWQSYWESERIYAFDIEDAKKTGSIDKTRRAGEESKEKSREKSKEIFSVDTPPPTVSGRMHIGHAFSFSQQDFIVRFQRMRGKNVFCPFGTDDNGVPTERLIEQLKKVRARNMPRKEFVKLCLDTLSNELRPQYIADWKKIGMSCDFSIFYTTINEHCQRISQREFLNLNKIGRLYRKDAPAMWCPECQTGISQVECQDKEIASSFNDIIFKVRIETKARTEKGVGVQEVQDLVIATTRPELLAACVAVFYHPDDEKYKHLKGKTAKVPLFNFEVPILEDERADPEKGTGIVMCCTFGDQTDMEWQKAHDLPIKEAITRDGKMTGLAEKYSGFDIKTARRMIIDDLKKDGLLVSQKQITHAVNVHERCGTEVEFIKSKQWFIKYLDLKDDMMRWGDALNWHPAHMKNRYDNWVNGLQWDWLISRQRYFGIPFPVWYCAKCDSAIFAKEEDLPVDPLNDTPPVQKCPDCGNSEFVPEKDVLDTWATSSLTPLLAVELMPSEIRPKLFPMTLRPQAHDIITFWLFNTTFRSNVHYKCNPWRDCMISGWALDPKGKKMSKSKGNVIEPQVMIEKYGADALRFWAAGSKLGEDLAFQEKDYVTGQKTITKLWNAAKFVLLHLEDYVCSRNLGSLGSGIADSNSDMAQNLSNLSITDKWVLTKLNTVISESTESFEKYEYSKARAAVEKFFWQILCDNYLEFVKHRLYSLDPEKNVKLDKESRKAAQFTSHIVLSSVLKLFAPIMPHITEEIYHLRFANEENRKSIHLSEWPEPIVFNKMTILDKTTLLDKTTAIDEHAEYLGDILVEIITAVRKYKTARNASLKAPIKLITVHCPEHMQPKLEEIFDDLQKIASAQEIKFGHGDIVCTEHVKIGIVM